MEGVFEHKPAPVQGGHDCGMGKAATFYAIDGLSFQVKTSVALHVCD